MVCVLSFSAVSGQAESFRGLYEKAFQKELQILPLDEERAQKYSWVFVTGFLNEAAGWVGTYFGDEVKRLREHHVSEDQIFVVRPSSSAAIEDNSEFLFEALQKIHEETQLRLMVITHSKASPEVLYMISQCPEESNGFIEKVLTLHAAFGSQVADLFEDGNLKEKDGYLELPFSQRLKIQVFQFARKFLNFWLADGVKSLTLEAVDKIFSQEVIQTLKEQGIPISFLRGAQGQKDISSSMDATHAYLSHFGPNDGMVVADRQYLLDVGTDLGIFDFDHADSIIEWPISNASKDTRYALMDAMMMYMIRE